MQIVLNLQGHRLLAGIRQTLSSGSKEVDEIKLEVDETWKGFGKTAVFCVGKKCQYAVVDEVTQTAKIPAEVLRNEAVITIGIVGFKDEAVMTSTLVAYQVEKGSVVTIEDPEPSIYAEILSRYADLATRLNNIIANAGDLTNNAELIDARVGADDVVYDTLGEAVRGQVGSLSEEIKDIKRGNGLLEKSVDLSKLKNSVTLNLLDKNTLLFKTDLETSTGVPYSNSFTTTSMCTDFISILEPTKIFMCVKNSNNTAYLQSFNRLCVYNLDKTFVKTITRSEVVDGYDIQEPCLIRVSFRNSPTYEEKEPVILSCNDFEYIGKKLYIGKSGAVLVDDDSFFFIKDKLFKKYETFLNVVTPADDKIPTKTSELENDSGFITKDNVAVNQWREKTWSAYGDSITAITNGNGLNLGWAKYVNDILGFVQFYGRGIGGQKFAWGSKGGSVSFINADGTYNSRVNGQNYDDYTGEIPDGTQKTRGCFCSWDRITKMYPSDIKDNIDLLFVMGSTNDKIDETEAVWVESDKTDKEWSESEYYNGGDYNIQTLKGGIASCVMKLQAWMPNAIIVLATPLSGRGTTGENSTNLDVPEYDKSLIVMEMSRRLSCPCVDVYGTCGINPFNRTLYITDTVHPYTEEGKMMLGKSVVMGLRIIFPRLTI